MNGPSNRRDLLRSPIARRLIVAIVLFVSAIAPAVSAIAEPRVITLNTTNRPPFSTDKRDGFLDIVATEAFRRIGVELRIIEVPPERALINANAGIDDGDISRLAGIDKLYPNLIRVPEKIKDSMFCAFSRDPTIPGTPEAMRQRSAGHIKGWKNYEKMMAGAPDVTTTDGPEQLLRLLDLGRIEVALYQCIEGVALAREMGLKNIHSLAPPLTVTEAFIYLHKKHAELVPKLAAALRTLKSDGFYDRVYREKVAPFSPGKLR